MKAVPKLSVVMSVHNGLPFLSEAVESVLHQSYGEFEFVVVDDGSTDDSLRVLSEYAARDKRMVLVHQQVSGGAASGRNRGIQLAQGEYLACQDADDISLPDRFARQVEFLDRQPDVGVLGTWLQFINENGLLLGDVGFPRLSHDKDLQAHLLDNNCICGGSVMMRRRCLDVVGGYNPELALSEDYDLWLRLAEVTCLANLPACLYLYRQHSGQSSRRQRSTLLRNKAIALERALARRYGSAPPERLLGFLVRDFLRAVSIGQTNGVETEARDLVERALKWSPTIVSFGPLLEDVVWRIIQEEPFEEAIRHAEGVLVELLPPTRHVKRVRSRVLSHLNMRVVFEAQEKGDTRDIGGHWWQGVRNDPRWLLNRGVWSIGMRHLLARANGIGGQQEP